MKSRKEAAALSERAALLVIRLIEKPSKRAENAARKWANQSPAHMLEILKTLCTVKNLDLISVLAEHPGASPSNPCKDLDRLPARRVQGSSQIPRQQFSESEKALVARKMPEAAGISRHRRR